MKAPWGAAVLLAAMLAGCTASDDPVLPPCRADALAVYVAFEPEPDTYHGVVVRAWEDDRIVDSDVADEAGCADLAPPPGTYRITADIATGPECGYAAEAEYTYAGGHEELSLELHDTC